MKKRIVSLLLVLMMALLLLAGCAGQKAADTSAGEPEKDGRIGITMYMWDRSMSKELSPWLEQKFPEIDFTESNALVDDGILESIVLVEIISTISLEMGILIPYEEIVPQNFNSLDAMAAMLERLSEE